MSSIVDEWADAVGGRGALQAVRAVYTRGDIRAFGLSGSVENWFRADGSSRHVVTIDDIYNTTRVYNHARGVAWLRDQNGHVRSLRGAELAGLITEAFIGSFSHFLPGRMNGLVSTEESDTESRVRVQPDGGVAITYTLDATTHLPLRSEQPVDDTIRTTTYGAWHDVNGLKFPFLCEESSGRDDSKVTVETREIRVTDDIEPSLFDEPRPSTPDYRFTSPHVPDINIEFNWNHILVGVSVNGGGRLPFLLDTGAQLTVVEAGAAAELAIESRGDLAGCGAGESTTPASLASDVSLGLPGVDIDGQTVAVIDLGDLFKFMGRRVHGVLGYDFMSRFVVEIDYLRGAMRLHEPASFRYSGDGDVIPMHLHGGVPTIAGTVSPPGRDPIEGEFLVDTGASDALYLTAPFVQRHGLLATLPRKVEMTVPGVGGSSAQTVGRVDRLVFGRQTVENPVTFFSHDRHGALANPNFAGVVGAEVLRRYTVWFDYPGLRITLERNSRFPEPFEFDRSGLVLIAEGRHFERFCVREVIAGSPAESAGVDVGDIVERVNGVATTDIELADVSAASRSPNRDLALTIRRGDDVFDRSIRLRQLV